MIGDPLDQIVGPRSPAEAKRHAMIDRLWIGSIMSWIATMVVVVILWIAPWPAATAVARINFLGLIAGLLIGRQIVVDVSFSIGGPVGRWKARWRDAEASAESDAAVERAYDGVTP